MAIQTKVECLVCGADFWLDQPDTYSAPVGAALILPPHVDPATGVGCAGTGQEGTYIDTRST